MLPFCGYNMGDYFAHWVEIGKKADAAKLPQIFYVNWFRKTAEGKWLWPGYGENSRVLQWVFDRCNGKGKTQETAIGLMPTLDAIDRTGLDDVSDADMKELLAVNREEWLAELADVRTNHYARFGDKLPKELAAELDALEARLKA